MRFLPAAQEAVRWQQALLSVRHVQRAMRVSALKRSAVRKRSRHPKMAKLPPPSSSSTAPGAAGESGPSKSKPSSRKRVRKAKDNGEDLDNDADRSASGSIVIEARLTNLGRRGTPPPDASPTSPSTKSATPPVAPVGPAPRPYKFPGQDILNSEVRVTDAPPASSAAAAQIVDLAHMPSSHLEVHINTFFAHFYPLIPVFTEAEFRADLAAGRVPPYMLYSLCAVTSLFLMVPIGNNGRPGVTNAIAASQLTVKRADPPVGSPPAPDFP
ncbi:hypothetical protein BCR44DRAFT_1185387 [Catenaria anguillulae PL171]|uniref:Uncharacterized protein n=1 Tax=Catenaria anguillulae PL171 TaxID=765915 RepID=A0A1Y2HLB0_9FUNG|nr:hypothetical protein BCR44DRAFT_1185387 [Catenaria anguillulae PL171]